MTDEKLPNISILGKEWEPMSIHGSNPHKWAWCRNTKNKKDQCRISLRAWTQNK